MQLALSRTREYSADLTAVQLTGDPLSLISALKKIDYFYHGGLSRIWIPGNKIPDPSLLRSHPTTQSRIDRLNDIAKDFSGTTEIENIHNILDDYISSPIKRPRRRISGLWY